MTIKMVRPGSPLRRSFVGLGVDPNDRGYLEVEVPAGDGVGTARAIARAYSAFAEGGAEIGITPETFARVTTPPNVARRTDEAAPAAFRRRDGVHAGPRSRHRPRSRYRVRPA
ncbi:MAG: hypothetical protein ACREMV_10595 [Gemmatimonadales bacterium]